MPQSSQNIERNASNKLSVVRLNISNMIKRPPVSVTLAANLKDAYERQSKYRSLTALAKAAGVAATSIGYMLNPETRQPSKSGKLPSPTIENVDAVAKALNMQAWQLIYPEPSERDVSDRQRKVWQAIEENMRELRNLEAENRSKV